MKKMLTAFVLLAFVAAPGVSEAGVKMKIGDDTEVDLGFRLQTQVMSTDNSDLAGASQESTRVRRARLRLRAKVTQWMNFFIQTESGGAAGTGLDMRMIDAFTTLNINPLLKINAGLLMPPTSRQNLTSSGALLTIDRPGLAYKSLTWGTKSKAGFTNIAVGDTDDGVLTVVAGVRDTGVTAFGAKSVNDSIHFKYYLGWYDGIQADGKDNERVSARVQVNFGDPEAGYFNSSTYLGEKTTIGVGVSYDTQDEVAQSDSTLYDYTFYSADVFVERPVGDGVLTAEVGYSDLDLNDLSKAAQGDGFYVQAGYLITGNIQPWIGYETWESDAAGGTGEYDAWRIGCTYFIKGHNANVKVGYESFNHDTNFTGTSEDSIGTFLLGFYITY